MKTAFVALVAVAGLAASASAQFTGTAGLAFQVSSNGGASWGSSVDVTPGTNVLVRLVASYDGNGYGFGKIGLGFARFGGANATDGISTASIVDNIATTPGQRPRQVVDVAGGRQLQVTRGTGGGTNPLAASNRLAWGQLTNDLASGGLNANYRAGSPVEVFRIAVVAGDFGRTIVVGGETATQARGYLGLNGQVDVTIDVGTPAAGSAPLSSFALTAAQMPGGVDPSTAAINIIPTPASLALLGLGGLVAGRRRR
jgi:MYXO-CTERM domain-containing protein